MTAKSPAVSFPADGSPTSVTAKFPDFTINFPAVSLWLMLLLWGKKYGRPCSPSLRAAEPLFAVLGVGVPGSKFITIGMSEQPNSPTNHGNWGSVPKGTTTRVTDPGELEALKTLGSGFLDEPLVVFYCSAKIRTSAGPRYDVMVLDELPLAVQQGVTRFDAALGR